MPVKHPPAIKAAALATAASAPREGVLAREEKRRALRCLLSTPLVLAKGPWAEEFILIRRHAADLREWLAQYPQWRLVVEPEMARLYKTPASTDDETRAARTPGSTNGSPFSRRSYMFFCLSLAALEELDRQTTLGRLAERVAMLAAADEAIERTLPVDFSHQDQRHDLVQGVKLMEALGIIKKVDGEDSQFVSQKGDALYNVQRAALAAILAARQPPSMVAEPDLDRRIEALAADVTADTDEGRTQRIRTRLYRRLLDDPVVYLGELTDDERQYLQSQRAHVTRRITEATGLIAEVRAEGLAMVDEDSLLTDVCMPEEGTEGHCTLLVAEYFAQRFRETPGLAVYEAELHLHTAGLIARYQRYWRKDASLPGAERELARRAVERLQCLKLVAPTGDGGLLPLAALGRYRMRPLEDEPLVDGDDARARTMDQDQPNGGRARAASTGRERSKMTGLFPDFDEGSDHE